MEPDPIRYLESVVTEDQRVRYPLLGDLVRIGRADDNDVVLNDPRVSRRHAALARLEHHLEVRDLGSRNGTFVNGIRLVTPTQIESGNQLSFGGVELLYRDGDSTIVLQPVRLITLDDRTAEVRVVGQLISPTPKEYLLIRLLIARPGEVCGRDEIARTVWPEYDGQVADYNIDNLIARLRTKVEGVSGGAVRVVAVKTRGYKLVLGGQ